MLLLATSHITYKVAVNYSDTENESLDLQRR